MEYINGNKIYNAIIRCMDETDKAEKENKFSTQEDTAFFAGKRSALEELRDLVATEYDKEDVDGEYRKACLDYLGNELGYKCTPPTCSDCLFFDTCPKKQADGICQSFANHLMRTGNPSEADGKTDAPKFAERSEQEQQGGVEGIVPHYANLHYVVTNIEQLNARLKDFEDGAEVRVFINARFINARKGK